MRVRLLIAALSGLSLATAAAAVEPAKAPVRTADQPADQDIKVIIAAADEVHTPAGADRHAAALAKRERRARVTTCRCGDQTPNE
ncbi:MAG: hypothetical protein ACR2JJ_11040 [Sphingomicrobium sp.]